MKSSQTRNALIASALSMLLCIAVLVSTTFAWFTETASVSVNKIVAGNPGVDLQVNESSDRLTDAGQSVTRQPSGAGTSDEPTTTAPTTEEQTGDQSTTEAATEEQTGDQSTAEAANSDQPTAGQTEAGGDGAGDGNEPNPGNGGE